MKIGVEIETEYCENPNIEEGSGWFFDGVVEAIKELKKEQPENYKKLFGNFQEFWNYFDVKEDGSLENGVEFITNPTTINKLKKSLKLLQFVVKFLGGRVGPRCGLHIHLDTTNLTELQFKKVVAVFIVFEDALFSLVSPSRRRNSYCRKSTIRGRRYRIFQYLHASNFKSNIGGDRYFAINPQSHYDTLEIRLHQGTTNPIKIINWIRVLKKLYEYALRTNIKRIISLKGDMSCFYNIIHSKGLISYCKERRRKFKSQRYPKTIKNIKIEQDKIVERERNCCVCELGFLG